MSGESIDLIIESVVILLLILINGLLAMTEMAVVSARKTRLLQRAEAGNAGAKRVLDLSNDPTRFLSTVQVGITMIGTLAGAVGGASLSDEIEKVLSHVPVALIADNAKDIGILLIVLAITYFSLVLGELVPKRIALLNPEGIAAFMSRPVGFLSTLARPVVALLSFSTNIFLRLLPAKNTEDSHVTPEDITVLMEQGEQVGMFEEVETDIVESVFRLSDLNAGSLMTPRTDIDWLNLDDTFQNALRCLLDSPHSHFPVGEGSLDNVQGILRSKDLLARIADGEQPGMRDMIRPAQFIPESLPVFEVMEVLRAASGNLALVIDEFGGVLGLITLFDVMEAMIGGISKRGEPVVPDAIQREDGSWLVEGTMRIDEFKDLLHLDMLPEEDRAGYQTVGGFMMTLIGSVPQPGNHFECCGWHFEVVDMDGLRVDKVLAEKEA